MMQRPLLVALTMVYVLVAKMRFRLCLLLSLLLVTCLSQPGCRARRQLATTDVVSDSTSPYWNGCDESGGCDSNEPATVPESEPSAIVKLQPPPQPSNVSPLVTRRLRFLQRIRENSAARRSLTCQNCEHPQSVLIDGVCIDCMRNGGISPAPQGDIATTRRNDPLIQKPVPTKQFLNQTLPSPERVDQIIQKSWPESNRLPENVDSTPGNEFPLANFDNDPKNEVVEKETQSASKLPEKVTAGEEIPDGKFESSIEGIVENQPSPPANENLNTNPEPSEITSPLTESSTNVIEGFVEKTPEIKSEPDVAAPVKTVKQGISGGAGLLPNPKFETFSLEDLFNDNLGPNAVPRKQRSRSEDDVDWGPPTLVQPDADNPEPTSASGEKRDPIHRPPPVRRGEQPRRSPDGNARSEEEVFQDLKNATLPNRVVFDRTPVIAQELVQPQETQIVLRAQPSQYYHEIQQLAKEQAERSKIVKAVDKFARQTNVPVIKASTMIHRSQNAKQSAPQFDFSPLPKIEESIEDSLDVGAASEITDQVYEPYEFPEGHSKNQLPITLPKASLPNADEKWRPHPLDKSTSDNEITRLPSQEKTVLLRNEVDEKYAAEILKAIFDDQTILSNLIQSDSNLGAPAKPHQSETPLRPQPTTAIQVSDSTDMRAASETSTDVENLPATTTKSKVTEDTGHDVLLRAIPETQESKSFPLKLTPKSKASFRFIQPSFQRVVEGE